MAIQYVHLGTGEFGFDANGQWFRFLIADLQPKWLTAHGRDLLRTFDGIRMHRVPWIRQADRDFRLVVGGEAHEPVIIRITVESWKRKAEEQGAALMEAMEGDIA